MDSDMNTSENEVRKCLKDPSITNNETMEPHQFLDHPKPAASEDQHKYGTEVSEKTCYMKLRSHSVPVYREKQHTKDDSYSSLGHKKSSTFARKQADVDEIDVFNNNFATYMPLEQLNIKSTYNGFYCNPKLDNIKDKARLFAQYHLISLLKYNTYQCQSLIPAPWGEPIQANPDFDGSFVRKSTEKSDIDSQESPQPLKDNKNSEGDVQIILKSGRHVKSKLCLKPKKKNTPTTQGAWMQDEADKFIQTINLETSTYSDKEGTGTCPICNVKFPQSQLTQHAAECGEPYSKRPRPSSYGFNRVVCENCDEVLPLDVDYEKHVRNCLAKTYKN